MKDIFLFEGETVSVHYDSKKNTVELFKGSSQKKWLNKAITVEEYLNWVRGILTLEFNTEKGETFIHKFQLDPLVKYEEMVSCVVNEHFICLDNRKKHPLMLYKVDGYFVLLGSKKRPIAVMNKEEIYNFTRSKMNYPGKHKPDLELLDSFIGVDFKRYL